VTNLNLEIVDIVIPLIATVFIGFISLKTVDYKQRETRRLKSEGIKVPWHRRYMLNMSGQELRINLIGRCVAFFLLIMAIQLVKAFEPGLAVHLLVALVFALVFLIVIPRIFVAVYRLIRKRS